MPIVGKLIKNLIEFRKKTAKQKEQPVEQQFKTLKKLLKKARDTEFGDHYFFRDILRSPNMLGLYQRVIPVFDYESMNEKWWGRLRKGKKDVVWPGMIKYFALSSGTSDAASKYIPVSKEMIRSITRMSFQQIYSMANYDLPEAVFEKQILMIGGTTTLDRMNHLQYCGDMSGISAANAMPLWFLTKYYKPGAEISSIKNWPDRVEAIIKAAPGWDISIICGIPSWVLMVVEKIVERYNLKSIHDMWPNLKVYVHGGIAFDPYKESFKKLLGKNVVYAETYMASEGSFGFRTRPHDKGIRLKTNNGIFYEFIPFNEENFDDEGKLKPNAKAFTLRTVKENVDYAIVISNCSGAWRYMIGDTVRFVNLPEPEIVITGRIKHFLSICGEHVSVDNMTQALREASAELKINVPEFTVIPVESNHHYAHHWYIGTNDKVNAATLAVKIDQAMKRINDDYKTERESMLGMVQVEIISPDLFYGWLKSEGKSGSMFKIPRVMKNKSQESWLNFLETANQPETV